MVSEVKISKLAKSQLDRYISYIVTKFKSPQSAKAVRLDSEETKARLLKAATVLQYCPDPELRSLGYRTIRFSHHECFFVYRVVEDTAQIDGFFLDLQDYENTFKQEILY